MRKGDLIADHYRVMEHIGAGGMGDVWAARDLRSDREVAIKLMHPHVAGARNARQRFVREAEISQRIGHPNVVQVHEVLDLDGQGLGLVMQRLRGMTLEDARAAEPPLSARDLCAILLDVASALGAAHGLGIVHRDVKPANIFLHQERGTDPVYAKVLDFGVSKLAESSDGVATRTGSLLGSPRYMSPEQVRGASLVDHRADIWALGVILFEGLTGSWPHEGDGFHSVLLGIATAAPKSIDDVGPDLPAPLRAVVSGCLSPLAIRTPSAGALAAQLRSVLESPELERITLKPHRSKTEGVDSADEEEGEPATKKPSLAGAAFASPALGRAWQLGGVGPMEATTTQVLPLGLAVAEAPAPTVVDPSETPTELHMQLELPPGLVTLKMRIDGGPRGAAPAHQAGAEPLAPGFGFPPPPTSLPTPSRSDPLVGSVGAVSLQSPVPRAPAGNKHPTWQAYPAGAPAEGARSSQFPALVASGFVCAVIVAGVVYKAREFAAPEVSPPSAAAEPPRPTTAELSPTVVASPQPEPAPLVSATATTSAPVAGSASPSSSPSVAPRPVRSPQAPQGDPLDRWR